MRRVHGEEDLTGRRLQRCFEYSEGMSAADLMAVFADVPSSELLVTEVVGSHATRVAAHPVFVKARKLVALDDGRLYIKMNVGSSDIIRPGR